MSHRSEPKAALSWSRQLERLFELGGLLGEVRSVRAIAGMLPSVGRGFLLRQGRHQQSTRMVSAHDTTFEWGYQHSFPEMEELYERAKSKQWNGSTTLNWSLDVDPLSPERPLLPRDFIPADKLPRRLRLTRAEELRFAYCMAAWMLSQFLHGEQGALLASAQVTESIPWLEGKLYGSTQVVDEGRHVEVFSRYLEQKLNKLYAVNDNLFTIIDALISDSRWDMKFLGMQIMIEGLALGAFGVLFKLTREPLLRELLRYVIQDEARHVHYGVLALRRYYSEVLTEPERRQREDWAFEIALLMRNRFLAHEVYEEWFEQSLSRRQWNQLVVASPGMQLFRQVMFTRLMPNLRSIGLLSERTRRHYDAAGLLQYANGADATQLTADQLLASLGRAD